MAPVLLDGRVPAVSRNRPSEGHAVGRASVPPASVSPIFSVTSGVSVVPVASSPPEREPAGPRPRTEPPVVREPAASPEPTALREPDGDAVLDLAGVTVTRAGNDLLSEIDWQVREDERWVVLGPNGAGKTTLLAVAAARLHPTRGRVVILGEQLGKVDVLLTAAYGVVGRFTERYDGMDASRGQSLLAQFGVSHLATRLYGTLSEGERKRVQIARALMTDPEVLMLDEPAAGLDLGGREDLVRRLSVLAGDPAAPALVLVTHHVEEIPPGITHALLLQQGRVVAAGPVDEALTADTLSRTFGLALRLDRTDGRYTARAL